MGVNGHTFGKGIDYSDFASKRKKRNETEKDYNAGSPGNAKRERRGKTKTRAHREQKKYTIRKLLRWRPFQVFVLLMLLVFYFREELFLQAYIECLGDESIMLAKYKRNRDPYTYAYLRSLHKKTKFYEALLGVKSMYKYLRKRGYEVSGAWDTHSLPEGMTTKELYNAFAGYVGREVGRGYYEIYYDPVQEKLDVDIYFEDSAFTLYIYLDCISDRAFNESLKYYRYDDEMTWEAEHNYTVFINKLTSIKARKFLCDGDLKILKDGTTKFSLGGYYNWIGISICFGSDESFKFYLGSNFEKEVLCHSGEDLKHAYYKYISKHSVRLLTGYRVSTLKHELGHAVGDALDLEDDWEYIARYFEHLRHRIKVHRRLGGG